jgi:segregation and condensation protein B
MNNGNLDNIVLALLFSADEPLSLRKLSALLEDAPTSEIKDAVERWQKRFDDEAWSIVLEKVAGGLQLSSRPEYAPYIARLYSGRRKLRLSKAALETLAIIAYKQPITRAEIEVVRGVGCGSVVANLLERSLVRITGKARVLGAPFLYGSTQEFLEYLGLNSLKDLPSMEELEALLEREEAAAAGEAGDGEEEAIVEAPGVDEEVPLEADDDEVELDEEEEFVREAAESGAARLGPEVDEPFHRPLGDDEDAPAWPDTTPPRRLDDGAGESDEVEAAHEPDDENGREEDLPHDPKE